MIPESFAKSSSPSPSQTFVSPKQLPVDDDVNGSVLSGLSPLKSLSLSGRSKSSFTGLSSSPRSYLDSNESQPHAISENTNDESRLSISDVTSRAYDNYSHHDSDSDSDSECGLAYADPSSDENDNNVQARPHKNQNPSILRSDSASTTSSQRVRFHGVADNSRSTAMAQALGIPPNTLNGMGSVHQRNGSSSSADTRSIYSRTTSIGPISGPFVGGAFNPTMETLMEEVVIGELPDRSSLTPSHEGIRHLREEGWDQGIGFPTVSPGTYPHRSNTVQVPPHLPESKLPKLPTRAKTTNDYPKSLLEPSTVRKEKTHKVRACVHCRKEIEDGRWIKVDTGSVLCERCWKNMYLPKVCPT